MSKSFKGNRSSRNSLLGQGMRPPILFSGKVFIFLLLIVVFITSCIVFVLGERSFLQEAQISIAVISVTLFGVLSLGLYRGVQLKPDVEQPELDVDNLIGNKAVDVFLIDDLSDVSGTADGFPGIIVALMCWILATILIMFLLFILANVVVFLLALVFWIFYNAFRAVYAHSYRCRGNLSESLKVGLGYTVLYTGWLALVVLLIGVVFA